MFETRALAAPLTENKRWNETGLDKGFECFSIPGCCTGNEGAKDPRFSNQRIDGCNANPSFSSG